MIDLHMHSRYSEDGEFTPAELVEHCRRQGIAVMSITDHNCARANAKANGIRYVSGIEIDCIYKELNFHVLGYGVMPSDFIRLFLRQRGNTVYPLSHPTPAYHAPLGLTAACVREGTGGNLSYTI